uniref:Reverse transcriptase zinc-binding domain-containing protein n=1 Tax=Lactuca sativa TaxID=4236 RepID=A0A9R1WUV9_LACSA|nr:hypothetical protein LSAT_V11C900489440 [Lactuca sativa]
MNLKKNWLPVIDRFNGKLSSWKAKSLSFGERLTLIKSALGNLPTYFFSFFVAPMGIINALEQIRRKFLWGDTENNKKIHWVTWEKVIEHKEAGGLGLGSLRDLNLSLIVKWWWRLRLNQDTLWSQVDVPMEAIMKRKVNKGDKTLFWLDRWIGNETLKNGTGKLPHISPILLLSVQHCISFGQLQMICVLSGDGKYHVDIVKHLIDWPKDPVPHVKFEWIKEVPIKFLRFIWRASLGRIPAAIELSKRGVTLESVQCEQCIV